MGGGRFIVDAAGEGVTCYMRYEVELASPEILALRQGGKKILVEHVARPGGWTVPYYGVSNSE